MPRGDKDVVMKYKLPVPPLEVQCEIVHILDSFTLLTAELTAELTAIFLFFEFISLIWTMTRVRVRENERTIKEDTGRGLFSFLLVFITSYLCFLFSHFLPDSPEIIYGIKGAFDVYGSLHNALLGLCAAGVISCLIRRHMS